MTKKYGKKNYKKVSLKWYSQGMKKIGYENCYNNNTNSTYLAKARTNSLQEEEYQSMIKLANYVKQKKKTQNIF